MWSAPRRCSRSTNGDRQDEHQAAEHADLNDRSGELRPFVEQLGRVHRHHDDFLDAGQDADDQERLGNQLTRSQ